MPRTAALKSISPVTLIRYWQECRNPNTIWQSRASNNQRCMLKDIARFSRTSSGDSYHLYSYVHVDVSACKFRVARTARRGACKWIDRPRASGIVTEAAYEMWNMPSKWARSERRTVIMRGLVYRSARSKRVRFSLHRVMYTAGSRLCDHPKPLALRLRNNEFRRWHPRDFSQRRESRHYRGEITRKE